MSGHKACRLLAIGASTTTTAVRSSPSRAGGLEYIINVLPIEDYLRGLGEVPPSWPLEAIKAQIVAARCYALTHLGSTSLYDVDDTTQYQVYLGADNESPSQNAAVDQTSGQVLMSGGRVIVAFFSASDGGHTG